MSLISKIIPIALTGCLALASVCVISGCSDNGASNQSSGASAEADNANTPGSAALGDSDSIRPDAADSTGTAANTPTGKYAFGKHHAVLTVEGYDPIEIELDADSAPITVSNFANLVEEGYYDGKTFYRFQPKFCMQGGTLGNSASGSDPSVEAIVGEFSTNGYDNELADNFGRGTVAMARMTDPDSASTTFFVTLDGNQSVSMSLDGQYAAFGTIGDEGMEIIDRIVSDHSADADKMMGMVEDEAKQAVIESIKMID